MKIHFTYHTFKGSLEDYDLRTDVFAPFAKIYPLVYTLQKEFDVTYTNSYPKHNTKDSIWIIGIPNHFLPENSVEEFYEMFCRKNMSRIIDYKGKVLFCSISDACNHTYHSWFEYEIMERVDGFISANLLKKQYGRFEVAEKSILIPRFVEYADRFLIEGNAKDIELGFDKKIGFLGRLSHITRAKYATIITNNIDNSLLDIRFMKTPIHNDIMSQLPSTSYLRDIPGEVFINEQGFVDRETFYRRMSSSLFSLCLGGTTYFTERHITSMALKRVVISNRFDEHYYDGEFLYRKKYEELCFFVDLSNLIEVCEYCLDNYSLCLNKAEENYQFYKEYLELGEDGSYTQKTWENVRAQFTKLGIF